MKTLRQQYVDAVQAGDVGKRIRLQTAIETQVEQENPRLSQPGALHSAAQWYARRGIAVFPCEPRGKRPLTRNGFKDATVDLEQITAWWTATPDANIGLPTGISFDVVDIDGPEGVAAIYYADKPVTLPPVIGVAHTARTGGLHLYIKPTGRGNKASFMPHVDYRGKSGYVIAPPSTGGNGHRYEWTTPLSLEAS